MRNAGTASFTLLASATTNVILPGNALQLYWNGTAYVSFGSAAFVVPTNWAAATVYTLGQQVITPGNALVECIVAGTSGATFTPAESNNWQFLAQYSAATWTTGLTYIPGQILQNATLDAILCTLRHTAAATFALDAQNWFVLTDGSVSAWTPTTAFDSIEITKEPAISYRKLDLHRDLQLQEVAQRAAFLLFH